MTAAQSTSEPVRAPEARRNRILDAAGIAFVRNGFHRTTMQDIASEAGMTAGNIYHYFKSKDVIVSAIAERQRSRSSLLRLQVEHDRDPLHAWYARIEDYFLTMSRQDAVLRIEVIAEASRNAVIADDVKQDEIDFKAWFKRVFAALAQHHGADIDDLFDRTDLFMRGALVSCAVSPGYDPVRIVSQFRATFESALSMGAATSNGGKRRS